MNVDALSVEKVSFSFGRKQIFSDLSLSLHPGEAFALVGHNGAGKTTLFHLILGYKFASRGEIKLFGESVLNPRARRQLGYLPERAYLPLEQSFYSYLKYLAAVQNLNAEECEAEVKRVAESVGLTVVMHQPMKSYSKGMLQKTMLAQVLLGNPRLIILDEPMSGLDPEARESFRARIHSWKNEGKTILFSTHALEDVEALADRVMMLDQGQNVFLGTTREWLDRPVRGTP